MFQQPEYIEPVSLKLSEVLADVGVDERLLLKRRRAHLLLESIDTRQMQLHDLGSSTYYFGSQSEGTTTLQLNSDSDQLVCSDKYNVIQDMSECEPGVKNYLMIQDDTVSPGYCLLQHFRKGNPVKYHNEFKEYFFRHRTGQILMKNTLLPTATAIAHVGSVRHGPAQATRGPAGFSDCDVVLAFRCKSWPLQARHWLDRQGVGQWPSDDMRRYCSNSGCFVVGVGSKGSENEELEWRISTSLAERCLMFNINTTQIHCCILMKMILKTFIKPYFENTISSFMCKTVVFHCIANTHFNIWRENNLLGCLSLCLFVLHNCILNEKCPHFIIPRNNLMRGNISQVAKPYILEILREIVNGKFTALLGIRCDKLGLSLQNKMNNLPTFKARDFVSGALLKTTAQGIDHIIRPCLTYISNSSNEVAVETLRKYIFKLVDIFNQCEGVDIKACSLLAPWLCAWLGTALASLNIHLYNKVSTEALTWISLGLKTDVSSSKLKLASIYYCTGNIHRAEIMLGNIEGSYDVNLVEPICRCHLDSEQGSRKGYNTISNDHNEEAMQLITAFCVKFLPYERNCVPHEIQFEMFRSTKADLAFRPPDDDWIHWAMVDSLPYLYFLQYKIYSHLNRQGDEKGALSNLIRIIYQEQNLRHRETALNLLGQCMEQEDRVRDALSCYLQSLELRERYNAANFHICRLISSLIYKKLRLGKV